MLTDYLAILSLRDFAAAAFLALAWVLTGVVIERPPAWRPSVTVLMAEYRREWMRQYVARETRIFDAQILSSLRQGTSFFASTCLLAMGGVLAVIGNTEPLQGVAEGLTRADYPPLVWQIRLLAVVLLLAHGFLKFVWSHRVFGYCAIMMAAVPNDASDPAALPRAAQAAELNIRAAYNFNRGLRSMYFALAALAWLLGPLALAVATVAVVWTLLVREFTSGPHAILTGGPS